MFVHPDENPRSKNSWTDIVLDDDGRIPAGILPDSPKPALLDYRFRTWHTFLHVSRTDGGAFNKLVADAKTVFSARTGRGARSYSAGETYFLPAAAAPRLRRWLDRGCTL